MKRFLKLCASLAILLLIVIWFGHVTWILTGHDIIADSPSSMASEPLEKSKRTINSMGERGSTVVLLQQSQVQTSKQLQRLRGIDQGWARWANRIAHCINVDIMAAVPDNMVLADEFSIIGSAKMFPTEWTPAGDATARSTPSSPYHQLVRSLFAVLSHSRYYSPLQWVVLANDHTFLIPQNLVAHLAKLDAEQLVYTGNQLALSYRKKTLSFASGGGGAVLSHPVAKLILVIWMLITEDSMLQCLLDAYLPNENVPIPDTLGVHWGNQRAKNDTVPSCFDTRKRATCNLGKSGGDPLEIALDVSPAARADIGCILHAVRQWLYEAHSENTFVSRVCTGMVLSDPTQVRLILSSSVHVLITTTTHTANERHSEFNVSVVRRPARGEETVKTATAAQLRRECSAPDKWAKTNPGIILINCLNRLFNVEFTDSQSTQLMLHPSIAPAAMHTGELFNVYGVLRTIFGEYDQWYGEAKQQVEVASNQNNSTSDHTTKLCLMPPALARDVISFHYVSTVESQLLYRIFDAQLRFQQHTSNLRSQELTLVDNATALPALCTDSNPPSVTNTAAPRCLGVLDILAMWPRTDENVGHYSRPLAKGAAGEKQAAVLHAYLSQVLIKQPSLR